MYFKAVGLLSKPIVRNCTAINIR